MDEIKKLYNLYLLKEVERAGKVKRRQESVAEHTYSTLILANYFFSKVEQKLDELKVMKMLLFHDLVEIEAGDTFVLSPGRKNQKQKELKASNILKKKIPLEMAKEYHKLWLEYEKGATNEAKFCRAVDKLDPVIHSIFKKKDWQKGGFTEKKLRYLKEKSFVVFPAIMDSFNRMMAYTKRHGYFKNGNLKTHARKAIE